MDLNWYDIEPHQLRFRGRDSSSVTLVADSVLSTVNARSAPVAIAFTATIEIHHHPPLHLEFVGGFYGNLYTFRSELEAVRNGESREAVFDMERLRLSVYPHERGVRIGVIVEGEVSSTLDAEANPWPDDSRGIADWLLMREEKQCYNVRFAFHTYQVDPPYLDDVIKDIDRLSAHIRSCREQEP